VNVTFLVGEDQYNVNRRLQELTQGETSRVDGGDIFALDQAINGYDLFGNNPVIVIENLETLDADKLKAALKTLEGSEKTVLARYPKPAATILKTMKSLGGIESFPLPDKQTSRAWVQNIANTLGIELTRETLQLLSERATSDPDRVSNTLRLCQLGGMHKPGPKPLETLLGENVEESRPWTIVDLLIAGNPEKAWAEYGKLDIIAGSIYLTQTLRRAWTLKAANVKNAEEGASLLGIPAFQVGTPLKIAKRHSEIELAKLVMDSALSEISAKKGEDLGIIRVLKSI
jgi:DNA polymerase III delta subunit